MAHPLRHNCKLHVAEEILDFIANNKDAENIRKELKEKIEIVDRDFEDALDVVHDLVVLIDNQKY